MPTLAQLSFAQVLAFVLVCCRVGGLVALAPGFGAFSLPWRFRALLALAIGLVIVPACGTAVPPRLSAATPNALCHCALLASSELLIGIALGVGVAILLHSAHIAGHWISQVCGLSLSEVLSPEGGEGTSAHAQLLYLVGLAAYVALGGHRLLVGALMESFRQLPPGTAIAANSLSSIMLDVLSQSFQLGIRGAAPAVGALLLSTVSLTLIGRAVPQLNVLSMGLGINSLVALSVLVASVGLTAHLLGSQIEPTVTDLVQRITHAASP